MVVRFAKRNITFVAVLAVGNYKLVGTETQDVMLTVWSRIDNDMF